MAKNLDNYLADRALTRQIYPDAPITKGGAS